MELSSAGRVTVRGQPDSRLLTLSRQKNFSVTLSGAAQGEERDLAGREDPERRAPEPRAPAVVQLGLPVPGQAGQRRLVEPDQEVERPNLTAVRVAGDLQVDPCFASLADLL